jgi:hypothetical protein
MARTLIVACAVAVGLWLLAGTASAPPAGAQAGSAVSSYDIELTLQPSGALRIHEDVVYTLGAGEEHGFRRFIPLRVRYDDSHDRVYRIDDVSVTAEPVDGRVVSGDAGGVDDLATAESNGQFVIRIGSSSSASAARPRPSTGRGATRWTTPCTTRWRPPTSRTSAWWRSSPGTP